MLKLPTSLNVLHFSINSQPQRVNSSKINELTRVCYLKYLQNVQHIMKFNIVSKYESV